MQCSESGDTGIRTPGASSFFQNWEAHGTTGYLTGVKDEGDDDWMIVSTVCTTDRLIGRLVAAPSKRRLEGVHVPRAILQLRTSKSK